MRTEVAVRNQQSKTVDQRRLTAAVRRTLQVEGFDRSAEVSIVLVDDEEMHELNKHYRGIDKPTDVLSFSQLEGETPEIADMPVVLGDIVISVDTAGKQAEQRGRALSDELDLLVVHGMLHLLGYDDQTDEGADEMREHEKRILVS